MCVRIWNLVLASLALSILLTGMAGCRWAGSMSPPGARPMNTGSLIGASVALCWFAGAVGLFFRNRLACLGSVLGLAASTLCFVIALVTIVGLYLFPDAQMKKMKESDYAGGYEFAFFFPVTLCSVFLTISLRLLIKLLRHRKEFVTD
jgi:hypothetical protein